MDHFFDVNRRRFLQLGIAAVACSMAGPALAAMPRIKGIKALGFHNLHTDERLELAYWKDGKYNRPALAKINHIMRDYRSGEECPINLKLLDMLHDLQIKLRNNNKIEIVSAYRSPNTNAMMARYSDGVATHSYHIKGMAVDIRMPGTSLPKLHKVALNMRRGGVGYYADSQFVHVDVGPLRRW